MMLLHHLPREIILEILTRLPFEYVIQCKEVCKTWRNILLHIKRDQKVSLLFAGKHNYDDNMQLYQGEYDEKNNNNKLHKQLSFSELTPLDYRSSDYATEHRTYRPMVGSHRGLVCLHVTHNKINDPICICNPFTGEFVLLPQLDVNDGFLVNGFGYLHSTHEYKIVRIYYNVSEKGGGQVQVFTLGDNINGWRNKERTDHYLISKSNGILSDGALHWLEDTGLQIVAFDLADEEFRSVPAPPCFPIEDKDLYPQLLLLGGYLSIVVPKHAHGTDIWSLKENKSGCKDWSLEFTILSEDVYPPLYHPFALTEENKVLLWLKPNSLFQYDPKTAALEKFVDDDAKRFKEFQAISYMKSDVSLALVADLPVVQKGV